MSALYMKLAGVDGECTVTGFEGYVDLASCSFGGKQAAAAHHGKGLAAGKVVIHDVHFAKLTDKCTPDLTKKLCLGQHYSDIEIVATKATGGVELRYWTLKMTDCIITSFNVSGTGSAGKSSEQLASEHNPGLMDVGTIAFRSFVEEYKVQANAGEEESTVSAGYDIATATETA